MRYPVNTSMRPSSMRTGTSTCTSRNGFIRMRRIYSSRLIRLAARSNWLSTMDFPVIVRGDRAVAVTGPPSGSFGLEAAPGQPARRVLRFGQRVGDVQPLGPAARSEERRVGKEWRAGVWLE